MKDNLNDYIEGYNQESAIKLSKDNHYIAIDRENHNVATLAFNPLMITSELGAGKKYGNYTVVLSSTVHLPSDFIDEYEYVIDTIFHEGTGIMSEIQQCMASTPGTSPQTCADVLFVNRNKEPSPILWGTNCDSSPDDATDNIIKICAETQQMYYSPGEFGLQPVSIKFALDFSDI